MTLKLTLDAFSGRPNPSVDLTPQEAADLVARLGPVTARARSGSGARTAARLGYRGIVIEQTGQSPRIFRNASAFPATTSAARAS